MTTASPGVRQLAQPIAALMASLFVVALATTFVLPGRPSPAVIKAFFSGMAGAIKAVLGGSSAPSTLSGPDQINSLIASGGSGQVIVLNSSGQPVAVNVQSGHVVPSGQTGQLVQTSVGGTIQ